MQLSLCVETLLPDRALIIKGSPFAGGEDYGYFDNPRVAGSIPVAAPGRVAQLVEHWNVPSSPHSPAGKSRFLAR
jgi:hypothetical protein